MRKNTVMAPEPGRIRKIKGSFGWIDHRFINEGYIEWCDREEILLYFFLVAVANKEGVSFWGDLSICRMLKLEMSQLVEARRALMERSLIAYREGIYQVLSLPKAKTERRGGLESIGEILRRITQKEGERDANG